MVEEGEGSDWDGAAGGRDKRGGGLHGGWRQGLVIHCMRMGL